jgi:hypothetical protein
VLQRETVVWRLRDDMDRITTPFGFHTTADEIVAGVDLDGNDPAN